MEATIQRVARPGLVIFICFLVAALEGYDIQAFGVAAPSLAKMFSLSPGQLGWVGSIAMIGVVLGAFVGGQVADRIGRKPVLFASVLVFGVFSIGTGFASTSGMLLATRLLSGLGFGGAMPNLIAIATEIAERRKHATTVTLMFCGMPAGGAAVALLARLAGPELDWRTIFYIGGILPLALLPLIWLGLPETRPQHTQERSGAAHMLFSRGRAPATLLMWAAYLLTLVVLYLLLNWLPTLVIAKGMGKDVANTATFVFNLTSIAGAVLIGLTIDRFGSRWPLVVVYLALVGSLFALSRAATVDLIVVMSGFVGFLVIGGQYSLYALPPRYYSAHERAAGSGAAVGVGRFGSIIGPLLGGQLRAGGATAEQVLMALVPVALAAGIAVLLLSFRPHNDHPDA